jgi:uncharacterized surface anchored protein
MPGNYTVCEEVEAGWVAVGPTCIDVTLECENATNVNFTNVELAALGDFVWNDENEDGIQDVGELGIAGVTVNLYACNGTFLATTTTDVNGYYLFDDLVPGDYKVEFILPSGYVFSPQYQGANPALDSNADPATGLSECVTLTCGETNLTVDAGMWERICTGCLQICKFEDKNGNRQKDWGEPWLSGWTFNVTDSQGNSQLVTTGASVGTSCGGCGCGGNYCATICGLDPGDYTVTEILQAGWTCTTANPLNVTVECDKTTTVVFGNQKQCTGCLKICKFEDKNGNRRKDWGEAYLSGWTFNVTDSQGNSQLVTTGGSVGTSCGGCGGCDYCVTICGLAPGDYTVTEIPQAGWTCTTGNPRTVIVVCGKTTTVSFGNQKPCPGCIKIYKYNDKNGDGKKDWGEPYLSGWTFNVTDSQNNSWSGTTNWYGYVTICNLAPGEYTITETLKAGWTCTTSNPLNVTVVSGKTQIVYFGNKQQQVALLR